MSSSRSNRSTASTPHADRQSERDWHGRVWEVVAEIPCGHVLTYGDVARLSGRPRHARRVGQALRRAPRELRLPWHRVINAQGRISLPAESSGGRLQRQLLEDEGVRFEGGRVDLDRFGYRGAVDRLCWGPAP